MGRAYQQICLAVWSKLLFECHTALTVPARNNLVNLVCVSGHAGIDGNEEAHGQVNQLLFIVLTKEILPQNYKNTQHKTKKINR